MAFAIHELSVGAGAVALSPMPRNDADFNLIASWSPGMVVSLTQPHEGDLSSLNTGRFIWKVVPVPDYGVPRKDELEDAIAIAVAMVRRGDRVLFHCKGGCGRSGMAVLRVLRLLKASDPLQLLRGVRPCAVETEEQMTWALR